MSRIQEFSDELDSYVKKEFNYKDTRLHIEFSNIDIYRKRVRLYIRFKVEWEKKINVLVLARIGFDKTRKRHGQNLLTFLCQNAKKYNIDYIGIESANKDAITFGKKFGFEVIEHENKFLSMTTTNLIIETSKLQNQLLET